ncbi:MAG: phosphoribulokinase [Prochloraceae cyanobacterium]|nr:phosphoribulokinase [Prochloraceae cyanobacterium]
MKELSEAGVALREQKAEKVIVSQPICYTMRYRLQQLKSPIILGVAGDSGSGKTTYCNGIRRLLGLDLVSTICTDGYHKEDREQRKKSGRLPLDPDANHLNLLTEHLAALKEGKSVDIPIYNHATGKFDPPRPFYPTPIIVLEGLHALYPQLIPWLDFCIFVDPDYAVKWQWKWERDIKRRGHKAEALEQEMLQRMAAYKHWIDFQKINANVVIKICQSQIQQWARHSFNGKLPNNCYRVELILEPGAIPLPELSLPFDLGSILGTNRVPFLLAVIPCCYWGRPAIAIHLDGAISCATVAELKNQIVNFTGVPVDEALPQEEHEMVCATQFTQLLIAWRFLEEVNYLLNKANKLLVLVT